MRNEKKQISPSSQACLALARRLARSARRVLICEESESFLTTIVRLLGGWGSVS